jgi:hypothetical protein
MNVRNALRVFFHTCILAAVCVTCCTAGAVDSNPGGSCTRRAVRDQSAVADVPDYAADSGNDPVLDPDVAAAEKLWRAYQASIFQELSASPDPHDWALATLVHVDFEYETDTSERNSLITRAAAALPDDALVQWIALQAGQDKTASPTADAALRALQKLEPDNAAVWNQELVRAMKSKSVAAQDAALVRTATSTKFDTHLAESLKRLLDTYHRHPVPDEYVHLVSRSNPGLAGQDMANFAAAMTTYAMSLPAFQHLVNACRLNPATGENASRASDCAAIGRSMATRGDTLIANRI